MGGKTSLAAWRKVSVGTRTNPRAGTSATLHRDGTWIYSVPTSVPVVGCLYAWHVDKHNSVIVWATDIIWEQIYTVASGAFIHSVICSNIDCYRDRQKYSRHPGFFWSGRFGTVFIREVTSLCKWSHTIGAITDNKVLNMIRFLEWEDALLYSDGAFWAVVCHCTQQKMNGGIQEWDSNQHEHDI